MRSRMASADASRIEREAPHPERNVLVFVQCGAGFDAAYLEAPRSYDVLLNYYREGSVHPKADIAVLHATPKGLRHGFGIKAVVSNVPLNLVQKWLGHAQLSTWKRANSVFMTLGGR